MTNATDADCIVLAVCLAVMWASSCLWCYCAGWLRCAHTRVAEWRRHAMEAHEGWKETLRLWRMHSGEPDTTQDANRFMAAVGRKARGRDQ